MEYGCQCELLTFEVVQATDYSVKPVRAVNFSYSALYSAMHLESGLTTEQNVIRIDCCFTHITTVQCIQVP